MLPPACAGCGDKRSLRRSLIRFAVFPYQCRVGALTYWSATGRSAIRLMVDLIRVRLAKTLNQHAYKKQPPVGISLGVLSLLRAFWSIAATLILITSSRSPPQSEKELVSNG